MITLENVKKCYLNKNTEIEALKNVSLSIKKGELVGVIGPNGAGKSTLFKIITGILSPTSGNIKVLGNVPLKKIKENSRKLGVLFGQNSSLWKNMSIYQNFQILGAIYDIDDEKLKERIIFLTKNLKIDKFLDKTPSELSLGERMKCEISSILLHEPELIILDEPSIGLDIVNKNILRDFLLLINKDFNCTIMISSHDLNDIERICNRLLIINKGGILYDGSLAEISSTLYQKKILKIKTNETLSKDIFNNQNMKIISGNEYHFEISSARQITELINIMNDNNIELNFSLEYPSLEETLMEYYL